MLPLPLPLPQQSNSNPSLTFEISRHPRKSRLFIYYLDPVDGKKRPVREVTWALADELVGEGEGEEKERECWVGVYAGSRLDGKGAGGGGGGDGHGDGFEVRFEGWELVLGG